MFKWTVEFEVAEDWVADGFEFTDERALDMLANDLRGAYYGQEIKAKVTKYPDRMEVLKTQGYKKEDIINALFELSDKGDKLPHEISDKIHELRELIRNGS